MSIKFKKLKENAIVPTQGSKDAAGYDLYACISEPVTIPAHCTKMIGTGLAITPPTITHVDTVVNSLLSSCSGNKLSRVNELTTPIKTFGAIFARSGLATKRGLRPANAVGVCDIDYEGEYIVALHNDTDASQTVEPNERIAQLVFIPYITDGWEEVDELEKTERGEKGFGSTGEK